MTYPMPAAFAVLGLLAQGAAGSVPPVQAQAPPTTEIYLASLTVKGDAVTIGKPANISNSPGYDNQPFFTPDGRSLLFTSDRGPRVTAPPVPRQWDQPMNDYWPPGALQPTNSPSDLAASSAYAHLMSTLKDEARGQGATGPSQTDIYRFELGSRRVSAVTATPESEYSPTVTPDGQHISVIRVEKDGTQRLWRFTAAGKDPSLVLTDVKPVGYHAWLDANMLALFVLGTPATLQVADARTGTADILARDIGAAVVKIPGGGASFVQVANEGAGRTLTISRVDIEDGKPVTKALTPAVPGASQVHHAWTPDGMLLMAHRGSLHAWRPGQSSWRVVGDLAALGLKNVTRLAVSPAGDRIAIVAQ